MRAAAWSLLALAAACGGGSDAGDGMLQAQRRADGSIVDDRSLCNQKDAKDLEVSETAGPGAMQPNVRRVWKVFGTGADRRKVLVCREVDTNLDGFKDNARFYNEEGQSREERADTNYDGKIDTWNLFAKGRLAEVRIDRNHDGHPDEWKVFYDGKLTRVKRDTNFDKKPDTWEMYRKGRLERMGVDLDGDERVDRWDHDSQWRRETERAQEKEERDKDEKKRKDAEEDAAAAAEETDEG
jgi:hypothetical protein